MRKGLCLIKALISLVPMSTDWWRWSICGEHL